MTATEFDPTAFKSKQRADWNAASPGWEAWRDEFERGAAPVTARLLDLGGVRPGQRVLDVATGHGEHADRDGTIRLPSTALCLRAVAPPAGRGPGPDGR
jgi:hypothetical protein